MCALWRRGHIHRRYLSINHCQITCKSIPKKQLSGRKIPDFLRIILSLLLFLVANYSLRMILNYSSQNRTLREQNNQRQIWGAFDSPECLLDHFRHCPQWQALNIIDCIPDDWIQHLKMTFNKGLEWRVTIQFIHYYSLFRNINVKNRKTFIFKQNIMISNQRRKKMFRMRHWKHAVRVCTCRNCCHLPTSCWYQLPFWLMNKVIYLNQAIAIKILWK